MRRRAGGFAVFGMVVALACGCAALGGPALPPQGMGDYHWRAIASNDVGKTTIYYSPGAVMEWVGRPLQGRYVGPAAIGEAWTKFFIAQGPMDLDISNLQERAEAGKQTVTARIIFKGRQAVSADSTLVFEGGRIVAETWRASP